MKKRLLLLLLVSVLAFADGIDLLKKELKWRLIGPFRGGRSTAVAGVVTQPNTFYFGATGGGVWKTTDAGLTWEPISDKDFTTGSVGAIAVSESDPNVVYVGMGEEAIRGNVSHGDGMYKSTDAGKTWKKVGLADTRQISRVRIHPRNPDLVYVAALGHTFGPNEERGVFRSSDGGKTWKKILYKGPKAGAVDLVFDPSNPNVLYAAFWESSRMPWNLESGGPGSGVWKSIDGGDTWSDLTRMPGMPKGTIGRIGITVSPANPDRLWAIVEADDGGVLRSDNAGRTWTRVNEQRMLRQRAWYYSRIYADPKNAERVYVLNVGFHRSNDGGRTFQSISQPHGDNHDLWIAPDNPDRMIESNDGGAAISQNAGRSWTTEGNQPTAQFYRVALDNDFPYNVYGAQQDNSTVRIASRTTGGGIDERAWWDVGGGESGWIAPHPKDPNIEFAGSYGGLITRYDHHTGQLRNVTAWPDNPMGHPAADLQERFQWNFPLLFSPHDTTLYAASQRLFKSTDEGQSWTIISPDLTRNDRTKQGSSGGPITKDNTSIEYYCTIFTVAESPVKKGVIWTGSDDGLVQVTQNGGGSWSNVTPKDMPEWIQINSIEASPFDPATAYFAATMYKSDDYRPYLYKTTDYGKTWTRINQGLPDNSFARVIREDPNWKGTLYAGTETGIWVSFDSGAKWQSLQLNLPVVPIHDLAIHKGEKQLVAATHGRAFWILDDLSLLRQATSTDVASKDVHLFQPSDVYRMPGGGFGRGGGAAGQNPAAGVTVYFNLKAKPAGEVSLEFLDPSGAVVRKVSTKDATQPAAGDAGESGGEEEGGRRGGAPARLQADAGVNRFVWDMRHTDASRFPGLIMWAGNVRGPMSVPGNYQVRLTVDGKAVTEKFAIKKDPRLKFSDADYAAQLKLLIEIRDKLSAIHDGITKIRDVRKQADDLSARWKDDPRGKKVVDAAKALNEKMKTVEETLYQTKNQSSQDPLNYPIRLNNKLAALGGVVAEGDGAPTAQSYVVLKALTAEIDPQLKKLDEIMKKDLDDFNKTVHDANLPAVVVKEKK